MNYQIKTIAPNDALDIMRRERKIIITPTKPKMKNLLLLCGEGVKVGWNAEWTYLKSTEGSRVANGKIFATADIVATRKILNSEVRKICLENGVEQVRMNFDGYSVNVTLEELTTKTYTWVSIIKPRLFQYYEFITKESGLLKSENGELKFEDGEVVKWVS